MKKYRVAVVKYLNTLPFLRALQSDRFRDKIEIVAAHPSRCADLLHRGEADIALCPVGALPDIEGWKLITDYCIGCDGEVRTVCIFSNAPFAQLETIVLSAESRTSNLLVQILDAEYWKQHIRFREPEHDHGDNSLTGYLYIGDICFEKEKEYPYRQDIGAAWKAYTGLPFAFACWVSGVEIDPQFEHQLNEAFADAVAHTERLTAPGLEDRGEYLRRNISYPFDAAKRQAFDRYLAAIKDLRSQTPS